MLTISASSSVIIPLDTSSTRLVIVVKNLASHDERVGSVSITQQIFFNAGPSKHSQWVTLFDHLDDDEYDGEMSD